MGDDQPGALQREREMQDHEREAAERDPDERNPQGDEPADSAKPAPPGTLPGTSGQP